MLKPAPWRPSLKSNVVAPLQQGWHWRGPRPPGRRRSCSTDVVGRDVGVEEHLVAQSPSSRPGRTATRSARSALPSCASSSATLADAGVGKGDRCSVGRRRGAHSGYLLCGRTTHRFATGRHRRRPSRPLAGIPVGFGRDGTGRSGYVGGQCYGVRWIPSSATTSSTSACTSKRRYRPRDRRRHGPPGPDDGGLPAAHPVAARHRGPNGSAASPGSPTCQGAHVGDGSRPGARRH